MATRSLDQVREGEVPAALAGLYRDVHRRLRTSWVPLFFRALAPHRGLLRAVWHGLRENVQTVAFEERADELRAFLVRGAADLGTPLVEPVLSGAGFDVDAVDDLRAQVALFHYADPKVLLCVAAVARAAAGDRVGGFVKGPSDLLVLPEGAPPDMPALQLRAEEPGGVVGEIFHEIMVTTHLPVAEVDLRVLGHWPTLLEVVWPELAPVFRRPDTERFLESVRLEAERLAKRLPYRVELASPALGDAEAHRATLVRLAAQFEDVMPRLALFATVLTVSLEGAEDALASPWPVDHEEVESLFS